ncbi:MAG TPA: response regulator [Bryobacteraceae bacterium]|nr:response regulator [Bryobacteraceae bacterium]
MARPSASPFPPAPDGSDEIASDRSTRQRILTVLIVEDNATDILVINDILRECNLNARVEIARNGSEALSFLQRSANDEQEPCPGLVLLDLNLPGVGGIEVLKRIRSRSRRVPVIVITSSDSAEDRGAVQKLNADAYFRKPTSLTAYLELGQVIQRVLGLHSEPGA